MSDRVSKELGASAKSLSESRECFIEVYIDNWWLIIIVYNERVQFQLFEQFGYYDCVIDLAKTAAAICDENDPDKVIIDKCH